MTKTPADELNALLDREAVRMHGALLGVAEAHIDRVGAQDALDGLAKHIASLLKASDLLGRRRTLLVAASKGADLTIPPSGIPPVKPGAPSGPMGGGGGRIPRVDFPEAMANLELRNPRLLAAGESMGALYDQGGFSLAKASEQHVVAKVQDVLARAMATGEDGMTTRKVLAEMGPWTRGYANTVYRNNLSTAYASGIFEQMKDPAVQRVIGALRFDAVGDADTTAICRACDGTIATSEHPVWSGRTPPLHHNCRSSVTFMDWRTLEREGRVRDGGVVPYIPNPEVRGIDGFGGRRALGLSP